MVVEVNQIATIRVKVLGVIGSVVNATIYDNLGNVFTTKVMNRVGVLNIFQTTQSFTSLGSYIIKTDDFEYYESIQVVESVADKVWNKTLP